MWLVNLTFLEPLWVKICLENIPLNPFQRVFEKPISCDRSILPVQARARLLSPSSRGPSHSFKLWPECHLSLKGHKFIFGCPFWSFFQFWNENYRTLEAWKCKHLSPKHQNTAKSLAREGGCGIEFQFPWIQGRARCFPTNIHLFFRSSFLLLVSHCIH